MAEKWQKILPISEEVLAQVPKDGWVYFSLKEKGLVVTDVAHPDYVAKLKARNDAKKVKNKKSRDWYVKVGASRGKLEAEKESRTLKKELKAAQKKTEELLKANAKVKKALA